MDLEAEPISTKC